MQALLDAIARAEPRTDAQRIFRWSWRSPSGLRASGAGLLSASLAADQLPAAGRGRTGLVQAALAARWNGIAPGEPLNWVYQCRFEGSSETRLMSGSVPEPHVVTEQGARYPCTCSEARTTACSSTWPRAGPGCASTRRDIRS